MNSLSQLNSLGTFSYTDNRDPRPIFDLPSAANGTVTVNQNDTHNVPVTINIIDIVRPTDAGVLYTIDLSNIPASVASWATIPSGVGYSNPSAGVYRLNNITTVAQWNTIKSALITPDPLFIGTFSYVVTISWITGTMSWTVNVTINDITNLSAPTDVYFNKATTGTITGNATVIDNYSTTWTVSVTPSNPASFTTLTAGGTGGTVTYNATTKAFTVVGTKTQVNSHLNAMAYVIPLTNKTDFSLQYYAVNNVTQEGDVKVQYFNTLEYIAQTRSNDSYASVVPTAITGGPLITDASYDGSGNYIMTIAPTDIAGINYLASQGKNYWAPAASVSSGTYTSNETQTSYFTGTISGTTLTITGGGGYSGDAPRIGMTLTGGSITAGTTITAGSGVSWTVNTSQTRSTTSITASGSFSVTRDFYNSRTATTNADLTYYAVGQTFSSSGNGSVRIYTRSGTTFTLQTTLNNGSSTSGSLPNFGEVISANLAFDTMAILAPGDDGAVAPNNDRGAVYLYTRTGTAWTFRQRIASPTSTNYFKNVLLSPDGSTLVIVAPTGSTGAIYVYTRSVNTWGLTVSFTGATNYFGNFTSPAYEQTRSVFTSDGNYLFVSDFRETNYTGSVSVYQKAGGTWTLLIKLQEPSATTYRYFGDSIIRQADGTMAVMATGDPIKKYIYTFNGTTWVLTSTINNPPLIGFQAYSVTTDGQYLINGSQDNSPKVYKLNGSTYEEYTTLTTANPTFFIGRITPDGAYIVGHSSLSGSQYLQAFTFTPNDPNASSFNSASKTLTLQGTRAFVNAEIDTIQLSATTSYTNNITLTYTVTTPRSDIDSRTQLITYTP
jgi:hypothetical protein